VTERFRLPGHFRPGLARCWRCGAPAVWFYAPGYTGKRDWTRMSCDRCVARGCSCQWDRDRNAPRRDKRGKLLPCCEYDYAPEGWILDRRGRVVWRPKARNTRFIAMLPRPVRMNYCPPTCYRSTWGRAWASTRPAADHP
jgi:hypothetical protein